MLVPQLLNFRVDRLDLAGSGCGSEHSQHPQLDSRSLKVSLKMPPKPQTVQGAGSSLHTHPVAPNPVLAIM